MMNVWARHGGGEEIEVWKNDKSNKQKKKIFLLTKDTKLFFGDLF